MPEVKYKFKSSLAFETVQFLEPSITVGELKELINKKQSIKTTGFDLKFKDCNGKVYSGDEEKIDVNCKIIVSRSPKIVKPVSVKKKDTSQVNKDVIPPANEIITTSENKIIDSKKNNDYPEVSTRDECLNVPILKNVASIPITHDFLKCSLCHNTIKDPTTIQCCKKNFCYECITGYLFDPDIGGSMECPDCKAVVSNNAANITKNSKLRDIISDIEIGKIDAATCDMLEKSFISDELPLSTEDNNMDYLITDTVATNKCDNNNERYCPLQDVDVDNDTNLFEDHLLNQISVTEAFEFQIQTHPSEVVTRDLSDNTKQITVSDLLQSDEASIFRDQTQSVNNNTSSISVPHCDNKVNQDVTWNTTVSNSTNKQSIKDIEFDPVLYMKFLKIVGENYPDELRKILSNNIDHGDTNHGGNKDDGKSRSSRTRSYDDDHRDKVSQKRIRRENDGSESRNKREYNGIDNRRVDNSRHYEESERRTKVASNIGTIITSSSSHMAGDRCHRSKERLVRKSNGIPAGPGPTKRFKSRSRSRDLEQRSRDIDPRGRDIDPRGRDIEQRDRDIDPRGRDIEPRGRDIEPRGRDMDPRGREIEPRGRDIDPRNRDIYHSQNTSSSSRYSRPQDNVPPLRDDRQRYRNDYSTQYRDNKQRYDRRSDR